MKVAVLLTCHNRKEKTIRCIKSVFDSYDTTVSHVQSNLSIKIFIVDDGCTDGTSKEIEDTFADVGENIIIIKGSGNLFWARGMALAWKSAMEIDNSWDFYFLVNDDTIIYKNCFQILFETHNYSLSTYKKPGVYSGITCKIGNPSEITYGGAVWTNKFFVKYKQLSPSNLPQICDVANANILLVPKEVMNEIGILNDYYQHGFADFEYSINARKKGFPVLVTSKLCGECDMDHVKNIDTLTDVSKLNLKERKQYFNSPFHPDKDYLYYIKRNFPERYIFVVLGRFLSLYFPKLYYLTRKLRGC